MAQIHQRLDAEIERGRNSLALTRLAVYSSTFVVGVSKVVDCFPILAGAGTWIGRIGCGGLFLASSLGRYTVYCVTRTRAAQERGLPQKTVETIREMTIPLFVSYLCCADDYLSTRMIMSAMGLTLGTYLSTLGIRRVFPAVGGLRRGM